MILKVRKKGEPNILRAGRRVTFVPSENVAKVHTDDGTEPIDVDGAADVTVTGPRGR